MNPGAFNLTNVITETFHPQPQFQRTHWQSLNGRWEFAYDDENKGLDESWQNGSLGREIIVPFPYQCELSGINEKEIHEIVWYARDFDCSLKADQDLLLHFGAVDYRTTVWVNGEVVGKNEGGQVPFEFNIAPFVQEGKNRLVLRVEDPQDVDQPRGKQAIKGVPYEIHYYCTTGIWQTVWLEAVPKLRIDSLKIVPNTGLPGFDIDVLIHGPTLNYSLEVVALSEGREVARVEQEFWSATPHLEISIPDAKLWSPDSPHLYDLQITLSKEGEILDTVRTYSGLRSTELKNGKFYLNGKPMFLKMILDQGFWPESYLAAPSDEVLKADVEWTKKFGFNSARKHQKVEDPRWLYWCDKLGLMVTGEIPCAWGWSEIAEDRLEREWLDSVDRDLNHPCVIGWVPFNESWGVPKLAENHHRQYAFMERVIQKTRKLDPTRFVIGNDGWEQPDLTDICSIHDYSATYDEMIVRYQDLLEGRGMPESVWRGWKKVFTHDAIYRGQPVMITECGGFLSRPAGAETLDNLYNEYGSVDTAEELLEKYAELMRALADLPFVSGFCYTQLTDVEQEMNGLLTFDRIPKFDPQRTADLHDKYFK